VLKRFLNLLNNLKKNQVCDFKSKRTAKRMKVCNFIALKFFTFVFLLSSKFFLGINEILLVDLYSVQKLTMKFPTYCVIRMSYNFNLAIR